MYEKILIPLDGSELAECILPIAENYLKSGLTRTAVLIRVVNPVPATLYDTTVTYDTVKTAQNFSTPDFQYWERKRAERISPAAVYLDRISRRFDAVREKIECEVLVGPVAETIAYYAQDNNVTLILMATHGRSGLSRLVMGSVAEQILSQSHVPVMMIRVPRIGAEAKAA